MTDVFEVPRLLEQDWKDWWTIHDYIAQGKSHISQSQKGRRKYLEQLGRGAGCFEGARHQEQACEQASKQDNAKDTH